MRSENFTGTSLPAVGGRGSCCSSSTLRWACAGGGAASVAVIGSVLAGRGAGFDGGAAGEAAAVEVSARRRRRRARPGFPRGSGSRAGASTARKFANGPHSIARSFTTEDGNIWSRARRAHLGRRKRSSVLIH